MTDWYQKQTIGDLADRAATQWPEREALVFGEQRWTFAELAAEVDRVARGLLAAGVQHDDKVCLWMTNRPEWIFILFAVAKIGAVLVPLNTRYRTDDVRFTIANSQSTTLITIDHSGPVDYAGMIRQLLPQLEDQNPYQLDLPELPDLRRIICLGESVSPGMLDWSTVLTAGERIDQQQLQARAAAVDPDGVAIIAYTSGTTGNPKGVMHGHCCIRNVLDTASRWGVTFNDVIMNYLPMFHLYAYSACTLFSVLTGSKQILMETFSAEQVLALVEKERATMLHGFDTHYKDLLQALTAQPSDLSSLRLGTFPAGQDNSAITASKVQQAICPTVSVYGMTELWCFPSASFLDSTAEQRCQASGFPSSGYEFRIVDPESGATCPSGVQGEIQVRSYMVTRGYYNNPQATRALVDAQGWLHSGDLGMVRDDGHIRFMGRLKDMLKVGGENVAPAEIELYLENQPAVRSAAVVGMPDERLGEVPVAFVLAESRIDEQAIMDSFKGRIASYKIPRAIIVLEEFPMTATGKLQKAELRKLAVQKMAS